MSFKEWIKFNIFSLKMKLQCLYKSYRHPNPVALQNAKQLAINLIQTIQSELQSYIQQQPPPIQSQQVMQQPSIQQIQQGIHF